MTAAIKMALFVRDLLQVDETVIKLGRKNLEQDFKKLQIVVDILGAQQVVTNSHKYNSNDEIMNYSNTQQATATINFYGNGAYAKANEFVNLCKSQRAKDLKYALKLRVGNPTSITNVKQLTGTQYSEQYEVEVSITHSEAVNVSTLRIDTENLNLIFNK